MWLEVDLLCVLHVHHTLVHWPGSLPTAEDNEVINMIHISCNVQSSMLTCLVCDVIGQPDEGPVATSWKGAYRRLPSVNESILDLCCEFHLVWPFRRDEADSETQMTRVEVVNTNLIKEHQHNITHLLNDKEGEVRKCVADSKIDTRPSCLFWFVGRLLCRFSTVVSNR